MPHELNHESIDSARHTPPARPIGAAARPPRPVPLAVWFVPTDPAHRPAQADAAATVDAVDAVDAGRWQLPLMLAEKIISDYANPGSTVLLVGGGTAAVDHAAARLGCRTLRRPARAPDRHSRAGASASVDLLIVTLSADLRERTNSKDRAGGGAGGDAERAGEWPVWAALLSARGILAVVLPPGRPPQQPAAVITAAVGAGLRYLQHIPTVLWGPSEDDLAASHTAVGVHTQLWRPERDVPLGELHPAHADVLLFTAPAGAR